MRMIDRVIRSMQDTGLIDGMSVEDADTLATAALEGMMEPNDVMATAGRKTCITNREQCVRIYVAMIDAALNE